MLRVRPRGPQRVLLVVRSGAVAAAREHDDGDRRRRQSTPARRSRCVRSNISLSCDASRRREIGRTLQRSILRIATLSSPHRARWWHTRDFASSRDPFRARGSQSPRRSSDAARRCQSGSTLHVRLEVHARPEQRLELEAGRGARRLEHRAALADHDALLRVALDAHDDAQREQRPVARSRAPRPRRWSPRSSAAARRASIASSCSRTSSAARNDSG